MTKPMINLELDTDVARYLAAAWIAYMQDTRFETALKRFSDQIPSELWLGLAAQARAGVAAAFAAIPPYVPPPAEPKKQKGVELPRSKS